MTEPDPIEQQPPDPADPQESNLSDIPENPPPLDVERWPNEAWYDSGWQGPCNTNPKPPEVPPFTYPLEGPADFTPTPERPRPEITKNQLILDIPCLGMENITVYDGTDEDVAMKYGVGRDKRGGWPWQDNSNTYIAGHRLGWKDTLSEHIFVNLPLIDFADLMILEDYKGNRYYYRVIEKAQVHPRDVWVTNKVDGKSLLSLQTCIQDVANEDILGPDWFARYVVRGERFHVDKVEEEE